MGIYYIQVWIHLCNIRYLTIVAMKCSCLIVNYCFKGKRKTQQYSNSNTAKCTSNKPKGFVDFKHGLYAIMGDFCNKHWNITTTSILSNISRKNGCTLTVYIE